METIPRQACKAGASVDIQIDVLLLHTGFSNEGDNLKIACNFANLSCSELQ